nr:hypothetical protein [Candidatus Njordarchaeota archaeon]
MERKDKLCDPDCEFFQCGQRKLFKKQSSGNPLLFVCGWVGDPCEGPNCAYAACSKGRLRQNMTCGLLESTVLKSLPPPPRIQVPGEELRVDISMIARPKVLKRIKTQRYEGAR